MFMGWGPCADFQFGLWISVNSIINFNTHYKRAESNLLADEKGPLETRDYLGYTYIYPYTFNSWTNKQINKAEKF